MYDLVKMSLFMGSDYTQGVKGIGPVNAIEIINSFPDCEVVEVGEGESQKERYMQAIEEALESGEE